MKPIKPEKQTPAASREPLSPATTGHDDSLALDEEVMDMAELEPEGSPADDFEANARHGAGEDEDFSSDGNPSAGAPDAQYEVAEDSDDEQDG